MKKNNLILTAAISLSMTLILKDQASAYFADLIKQGEDISFLSYFAEHIVDNSTALLIGSFIVFALSIAILKTINTLIPVIFSIILTILFAVSSGLQAAAMFFFVVIVIFSGTGSSFFIAKKLGKAGIKGTTEILTSKKFLIILAVFSIIEIILIYFVGFAEYEIQYMGLEGFLKRLI